MSWYLSMDYPDEQHVDASIYAWEPIGRVYFL